MSHFKIEQILAKGPNNLSFLKNQLNKARIQEMKMFLIIKKQDAEIQILKSHSDQFQERLKNLEEQIDQDLELPSLLKKIKKNVFDVLREIGDTLGPGMGNSSPDHKPLKSLASQSRLNLNPSYTGNFTKSKKGVF